MGKIGIPVNIMALLYTGYVVTWMPFPQELPITAANFNYAGPVLGVILILACIDYAVSGRHRFQVPLHPKSL
jgi:choline transport protein